MENGDAELETKAFAEFQEPALTGRTQLSRASPTFCSWASLGQGRAHLQRGSRRQTGVVLRRSKGKTVLLGVLVQGGTWQPARSSDGGPRALEDKTDPTLCWARFLRLLDASAAAGVGQLVRPRALEGLGSLCNAKGGMSAVC